MPDTKRTDDSAAVQGLQGEDLDVVLMFNLLRTHSDFGPYIDADLRQDHLTAAQLNALLARPARALGMRHAKLAMEGRNVALPIMRAASLQLFIARGLDGSGDGVNERPCFPIQQ